MVVDILAAESTLFWQGLWHTVSQCDGSGGNARRCDSRQPCQLPLLPGVGFRISGFGFRVSGYGLWVSGFGFRISGFGFRVSGFGFRGWVWFKSQEVGCGVGFRVWG